jgi:2-keto-4-pentenoate hydratase/2-oxohepta-3-ene-1,7-dioic acid hydratase in catechol pathway
MSRAVLAPVLALWTSACAPVWEPAFDERVDPASFDTIAVAPLDDALTFARVETEGRPRLLAVTAYAGGTVQAVDLSVALGRDTHDPIALLTERGWDGVRDVVRVGPRTTVPATSLVMPVDLTAQHVAAATNFPEHAGDAGVKDGPFLFPKLVEPTGPYAPVSAGQGLLDYEVEIGWVTLGPLRAGDPVPDLMGFVLCNDFTDRDTLLHVVDPWDPASGTGFTTGKSFPGYLPVGNLVVVPRDHRRFTAGLTLQLAVNDELRQRSPATAMVWDLDEIVRRTWAWKDRRWDHRGRQVSLLPPGDVLPPGTLILSGTPHGTLFDGLRARHYASGVAGWLFGGWREPVPRHVVDAYVADARRAGVYLRPGDRVDIRADGLGVLRNPIVP